MKMMERVEGKEKREGKDRREQHKKDGNLHEKLFLVDCRKRKGVGTDSAISPLGMIDSNDQPRTVTVVL